MKLRYYINSEVCKGIEVGNDLYIESQIKHLGKADRVDQPDTERMSLTFSKVSEEDDDQSSNPT